MTEHDKYRSRCDLARQADAMLRRARCDTVTGAKKDRQYHRAKKAERKRLARLSRARRKKLGTFGLPSPVKTIMARIKAG